MTTTRIGRIYWFAAAHFLPNHKGLCKNTHGHNYKVEILLEGKICEDKSSPRFGMIMDFSELDKIVNPIIKELDHKNLNHIISCPTAENISKWLAKRIAEKFSENLIPISTIIGIKVWENHRSYATWEILYENL